MKVESKLRSEKKFVLDVEKLELADIILIHGEKLHSKAIQKATGSHYSHAALYVGDGSYIDSVPGGVRAGNPQRLLMRRKEDFKVLRLKSSGGVDLNEAIFHARREVGTGYSTKNATRVKVEAIVEHEDNRQFCSHLVAEAYSAAGVIIEAPDKCSPATIEASDLFFEVQGTVREATKAEVDFAKTDDPAEKQARQTREILKFSREKLGYDVQDFNELSSVLIKD